MVSFLSSWVITGDTGTIRYILTITVFSQTTRQLDAWLLDMYRGGPPLNRKRVVQFIVALCLSSRSNTSESTKDRKRIIKSFHRSAIGFWMIGWPGLGSRAEKYLHCGAELVQKRRPLGRSNGRCHRGGVVLQVFDRSDSPEPCKVQVLAKALEGNDHVTHLNLEWCRIGVKEIKVGSLVWDPVSGVEVRGDYP